MAGCSHCLLNDCACCNITPLRPLLLPLLLPASQEVTSRKDQQQYWTGDPGAYTFTPILAMHQAFLDSPQGRAQAQALQAPAAKVPQQQDPLVRQKYALGRGGLFKACLRREFTLMKRNAFLFG